MLRGSPDLLELAAVHAFQKHPTETFPDSVMAALLDGAHPIKAFREHRGLTQAQLASKVGATAVYISQLEHSGRRAGRELRSKIGAVLEINATLLERHED
jgi:ribosome-binding protein aMBF1 (putative translation factor)